MNDCGCVYVECDEYADVGSRKLRKAAKLHKCSECGRDIEAGEEYEYSTMLFDGHWDDWKMCEVCLSVRKSFFCEGWIYGTIWDDLEAHIFEMRGQIAGSCITPLISQAREKVCQLIEDYWDKYEDDEDEPLFKPVSNFPSLER